jgi:hypothetical protein
MAAYSYAAGSAMQIIIKSPTSGSSNWTRVITYDSDPTKAAKLHIEYTEAAASGNPYYAYAQM